MLRKRALLVVAPVALATGLAGAVSYPTRRPCVESYGKFSGNPNHDTLGPDGVIWTAEGKQDLIARFDPNTKRVTREIRVPKMTQLHDLLTGPDGDLWYTGNNNALGKVDIHTGKVTSYKGLKGAGNPHLWFAPNGKVYVSEVLAGRLATFDPSTGRITDRQYNLPADSGIHGFAQVGDGSTWWGLENTDQLAHFDLAGGRFDRFVQLRRGSGPHWMLYVPQDDAIWIAFEYSNEMGRFDLRSGQVTYVKTPLRPAAKSLFASYKPFPYLTHMVADAAGRHLWIATLGGNAILRLDLRTHAVKTVTCGLDPGFLATTIVFTRDAKGHLWVTEPFDKKLGEIIQ